uniref:ATP synthase subunit a n=1 Tax=Blastobotrys adeninivorans TaxID=409370 RepID=A0A060RF29_BLAAD
MLLDIRSPLSQFEVQTYISTYNDNLDINWLSLTNVSVYNIIVLLTIILLHVIVLSNNSLVPTKWQVSIEAIYYTTYTIVINQLGEKGSRYVPLIYTLLIYILISNLVSLVPYNFAILSHIVYTISLSTTIMIAVTLLGFSIHKINYFSLFVPSGTSLPLAPLLVIIEFISYTVRALSLGLRLGANILAGHLLLVILSGLVLDFMSISLITLFIGIIPFAVILGIVVLEIAVAIIQAYVFCVLTSSYIKDALLLH